MKELTKRHLCSGSSEDWVEEMVRLHRHRGVRILGGCCGTTERHLQALVDRLGY